MSEESKELMKKWRFKPEARRSGQSLWGPLLRKAQCSLDWCCHVPRVSEGISSWKMVQELP